MSPEEEGVIYGPWETVGKETVVHRQVATVVKGLSNTPVQTVQLPIYRTVQRRKVWRFEGYEERTVES